MTEIEKRKEILKQRRDKEKEGKGRSQIWKKKKRQRRSLGRVATGKGKDLWVKMWTDRGI